MANIFSNMKDFVEKQKRNTFDLSFTNNLTFDFGDLVPVFCKEVIPGDSFRITPSFGLRLMPLVFPVQTRINANLHFFYVRNRNLWKDWPDFIGRTKQGLVAPYLNTLNLSRYRTGSLADYLGVPTTLVGNYGNTYIDTNGTDLSDNLPYVSDLFGIIYNASYGLSVEGYEPEAQPNVLKPALYNVYKSLSELKGESALADYNFNNEELFDPSESNLSGYGRMFISKPFDFEQIDTIGDSNKLNIIFNCAMDADMPSVDYLTVYIFVKKDNDWYPLFCLYRGSSSAGPSLLNNNLTWQAGDTDSKYYFNKDKYDIAIYHTYGSDVNFTLSQFVQYLKSEYGTTQVRLAIASELPYDANFDDPSPYQSSGNVNQFNVNDGASRWALNDIYVALKYTEDIRDINDIGNLSPFKTGACSISALPFRAYESIYNAFYRNQFNDPFMIDGVKEYNKFLANTDGSEDDEVYTLHKRNYELDFLTSAKQSPVDGDITPLVGVNASGKFTFKNGDGTTYTVTPQIGDDGHTLTGIESMEGTPENNSGLRRLVDMISLGISINDFRNVNALQRWLETNLRRGYRYKDQILSHFGVDVKYEELDMPEFIGGMSEPVIVNQVNQSVDQTGNETGLGDFSKVLGSYAGQASILAQSKHSITKYCDEHGFIIGILSVTPVPCYSQLLPKFMIKNNVLDYYFPEFGHIGNQPITYKEVCPVQAYAAGDSLTDVFGYQRAWYDYLASVDEVHGDFRKSLHGFLITRMFDVKPQLGKTFLEVNKDSMTNPFSVTDDTNKILGQVYFDVSAQRPIPKYGIPRLE